MRVGEGSTSWIWAICNWPNITLDSLLLTETLNNRTKKCKI
ncbi:hypothetical protein DCAR_0104912 [Daucus carota subsp. sativus]|uniref:Uncharacterized protein n=1 Tax=Daucus carota subsp. sativus TaxID=79200 RepID=A0AAF0WCX5_DAUCS|nr:hypothetical protein DCAR_0104912 [Daucus carota subsp. sativus]